MTTAVLLIVFFVALFLSLPIAVALLVGSLSVTLVDPSLTCDAVLIFRSMSSGLDSFVLLAIPLFILSGNIMAESGISAKLFTFFSYFMGNKTAGLPITVVISCLFYGSITGSGPATVAAIGAMTIPLLVSLGYDKMFVTALVAISGGLGVIIPPSIPFVMYGQSANVSVGDLFTAGILPGILIGIFLMICAYLYCKKHGEDKDKLRESYMMLRNKGFWQLFKESFLALLTPVIILGGIYSGIATPTEAACTSVFYALIVSFFAYKTLKISQLPKIFRDSVSSLVPMLFVAASATVFARVLAMLQAPQMIAAVITSTVQSKVVLLLIINMFLLVMGMLMDAVSAILICVPIFMPLCYAMGINPTHFGVIMVCNLAIGFVTPPVGINLFVASAMTKIPVLKIARHAAPFIIWFLGALLIITFIPQISLLLLGK
jgi:C4-dicarboxylate transporter DctM subunit